jgi:hypothetical protein
MSMMLLTAKQSGRKRVMLNIEAGANDQNELRVLIQERRSEEGSWKAMVNDYRFVGKKDVPAIQAADILAYESWKRV